VEEEQRADGNTSSNACLDKRRYFWRTWHKEPDENDLFAFFIPPLSSLKNWLVSAILKSGAPGGGTDHDDIAVVVGCWWCCLAVVVAFVVDTPVVVDTYPNLYIL
jgi:hypothetical protein